MRYLTLTLLFLITVSTSAQTPTGAASNIVFNFTGCNEVDISWTNGNGSDRVVFMREGSAVSNVPELNEFYSSSSIFAQGEDIKGDKTNFCIYRGTGNSLTVKGLKISTKYCIAIFEYNGGGGIFDYKTDTYPVACITTKNIVAKGYLYDSRSNGQSSQCLKGNSFQHKNNSTSDITPLTFTWKFGDGDSSYLKEPKHSYKTVGVKNVTLIARVPGCYTSNTFNDTVHPHPVAKFDLEPNDSIQCWFGNRFTFKNATTLMDIGAGLSHMRYEWHANGELFGIGYKADKAFDSHGAKTVKLVAVSNHGCRDSTYRNYKVLPRVIDTLKVIITPKSMVLLNNKFTFTNNCPLSITHRWYLSKHYDKKFYDTLVGKSVNYSFKETGWYYIVLETKDSINQCIDKFKDSVEVKQNVGISCSNSLQTISIYPNPSKSGVFHFNNLPVDASLKVFDIIGKELVNPNSTEINSEINLTAFGAGSYILTIWSEGRKFDYRLVVL